MSPRRATRWRLKRPKKRLPNSFQQQRLTPELSRAAKRRRLGRIVRPHLVKTLASTLPVLRSIVQSKHAKLPTTKGSSEMMEV